MRAAWRAGRRYTTLGTFDNALGVDLGLGARADYVIIEGYGSFHGQLPAGVTRQRMEKEDGAEDGLKETDIMVAPLDVRQLVSQHRASLHREGPVSEVRR